jgi:dTDP-glucose pyrophosphorylase
MPKHLNCCERESKKLIFNSSHDFEKWQSALLPLGSTIEDAVKNLDKVAIKIVLVINSNGEFEGTVSDGDIRRALLSGLNFQSLIDSIVHRGAFVVPPKVSRETVLQLMVANKIQQIPVINDVGHVVGLHIWDEVASNPVRSNVMIIMAGGKGTRLRPHTETCPKPLLPIAGKPMLEHIIENAKQEGFSKFIISINYLGEMIVDHFDSGERWDVHIEYVREDSPLGTAGALGLLAPTPIEPFLITNGDVITDIRYGKLLDFHKRCNASATMAVRVHEWQNPFGVVHTNGVEIVGFEEKPVVRSHINAGVYALSPDVLGLLAPHVHCDMPTLFELAKAQGLRTVAYPMHEPWLDVGRPTDLALADAKMRNKTKEIGE